MMTAAETRCMTIQSAVAAVVRAEPEPESPHTVMPSTLKIIAASA